jgi:UDP-GlcNAc3NAcA epimerase
MQLQLQKHFTAKTLHTGQHYDDNMSKVFFEELNMPRPDFMFDLGGSKPQGEQTAIMLTEIEKVCLEENFDAILVYGDTNSTLAGALIASKMHIPLIHIEAGLRSYNRTMPEEVNRIIADQFAQLLFCPSQDAVANLKKEGVVDNIYVTGDVMCDMIHLVKDKVERLVDEPYYFSTIHRPYNTDDPKRMKDILYNLNGLDYKVVLAIHPRTRARLNSFEIEMDGYTNISFIDPTGYIDSISYQTYSEAIITDSGGMQKEAYILEKKCITLRSETEWTETLKNGWNHLVYDDLREIKEFLNVTPSDHIPDLYGNGNAASEIVDIITKKLSR